LAPEWVAVHNKCVHTLDHCKALILVSRCNQADTFQSPSGTQNIGANTSLALARVLVPPLVQALAMQQLAPVLVQALAMQQLALVLVPELAMQQWAQALARQQLVLVLVQALARQQLVLELAMLWELV